MLTVGRLQTLDDALRVLGDWSARLEHLFRGRWKVTPILHTTRAAAGPWTLVRVSLAGPSLTLVIPTATASLSGIEIAVVVLDLVMGHTLTILDAAGTSIYSGTAGVHLVCAGDSWVAI